MNRKLSIGFFLLFITLFLIGCTEVGIGLTNIGDIKAKPNDYIGKEVTIEGTCDTLRVHDGSGHYIYYDYENNLKGGYRLTGIIKKGDIGILDDAVYIDVTDVKAI